MTDKLAKEWIVKNLPKYLQGEDLPWMQWVRFNGVEVVAAVNLERSLKAKRAMIDIHFCMTKAMNNIVEQTVKFNPRSFKKSKFK